MTLWIDNQLPPALAGWMRATLSIDCLPVRDLNLQRATDPEIFAAARGANVVVLTKDANVLRGSALEVSMTTGVAPEGREPSDA